MSAPDRRAMLDRADRTLSPRRQCALLGVARSGVSRPGKPANDNDAALMRRIDELFTAWPFLGSRRMTAMLRADGVFVNRKRVQRLMRLMGSRRSGRDARTSKPAPDHRIYPYLLRNLTIERANHVWAADISVPSGARDGVRTDQRTNDCAVGSRRAFQTRRHSSLKRYLRGLHPRHRRRRENATRIAA